MKQFAKYDFKESFKIQNRQNWMITWSEKNRIITQGNKWNNKYK